MLAPVVEKLGYDLLGIEQNSSGRNTLLRLYIDNEDGIGLDDCERVSDQVTGLLDVHDPIRGSYTLEVSSPGLDRPFFTLDQIRRYCGRTISLVLRQKLQGRRKFTGRILSVEANEIVINVDGMDLNVAAENIDKARLVPEKI